MVFDSMNLYILTDVLYDYTSGMAVISAESEKHAKQLFMEKFGDGCLREDRQNELDSCDIQVIQNVNHPAGVVSHVYGGG
jgi:hypothetical protein